MAGQACANPTPHPGGNNTKTYLLMSSPEDAVKKQARQRYEEIDRLYQCRCSPILSPNWLSCTGSESWSALEYELSVIAARMQARLRSLDL